MGRSFFAAQRATAARAGQRGPLPPVTLTPAARAPPGRIGAGPWEALPTAPPARGPPFRPDGAWPAACFFRANCRSMMARERTWRRKARVSTTSVSGGGDRRTSRGWWRTARAAPMSGPHRRSRWPAAQAAAAGFDVTRPVSRLCSIRQASSTKNAASQRWSSASPSSRVMRNTRARVSRTSALRASGATGSTNSAGGGPARTTPHSRRIQRATWVLSCSERTRARSPLPRNQKG